MPNEQEQMRAGEVPTAPTVDPVHELMRSAYASGYRACAMSLLRQHQQAPDMSADALIAIQLRVIDAVDKADGRS